MTVSFVAIPENRDFFREKAFSFGVAIAIILLLSPKGVADAYLILGHSHFMMTALYQYKAGRITIPKFIAYLTLFYLMFKVAHAFPLHYTLFASAFLLLHVFSGEIRHFKRLYTLPYFLMTLCIMSLLCSWLIIEMWGLNIHIPQLIFGLNFAVILACCTYYKTRKDTAIDAFFPAMVLLYVFYVFLEYSGNRPASYESFGFIVIAHYLSTYYNVFFSFRKKSPAKARLFVRESLLMNSIFLFGYVLIIYRIGADNLLYDYAYHPISFYVWTVMHFITTWNNQEFKHILAPARV